MRALRFDQALDTFLHKAGKPHRFISITIHSTGPSAKFVSLWD